MAALPPDPPFTPRIFRLSDVTKRLREILLPAMAKPFWIRAQFVPDQKQKAGSHIYGNLVESGPAGTDVAKVRATIWRSTVERIESSLGSTGGDVLAALRKGGEVCAQCSVRYHMVHGLTLEIVDVNPTMGESHIARNRRAILEALFKDGLLERNKQLSVPVVPLRIGLVTATDSAAYADFERTLAASGFAFRISHVSAVMQGDKTASSVVSAIRQLAAAQLDVLCVIRGGGSPVDLAWLDHEQVARAVALAPVPVWVGIGHEIDVGVLDQVAHSSHKTPTAVAEALVAQLREVAGRLAIAADRLQETTARIVDLAARELALRKNGLRQGTRKHLQMQEARFAGYVSRLETDLAQQTERFSRRHHEAATRLRERTRRLVETAEASLQDATATLRAESDRQRAAAEEKLARSAGGLRQGVRKQSQLFAERLARRRERARAVIDSQTDRRGQKLTAKRRRLETAARVLHAAYAQRLEFRAGRISLEAFERKLVTFRERLSEKQKRLDAGSPERLLARGYSISRTADGKIVRSIADVPAGAMIVTEVQDGTVTSIVQKIEDSRDGRSEDLRGKGKAAR